MLTPYDDETRDWYEDEDEGEDGDCYRCGGEGWVECPDPIECTRPHRIHAARDANPEQWCACGSCGGSGRAKDMTIW